MSQHDYILDNQDGASFRADINSALAAIASCNSGATAPATTYAYQVWHDTTTGIIKQRNAANSAWLNLADVLLAGKTVTGDLTVTGLLNYTNILTRATAQNTTSGTVVDFTGIPSWVRRITVMFNGVSTSGTSNLLLQLGDSGGIENTGYTSIAYGGVSSGSNMVGTSSSAGFILTTSNAGTYSASGVLTIGNLSGNIWVLGGSVHNATYAALPSGTKTLSDVLTQLRITTVNGTDTFDAGSVNILYE